MTPGSAAVRSNHVGIATPDIDASVAWYVQVLGMRLLRGPETVTEREPSSAAHQAVFGPAFTGCRVAFLSAADGFGIELFEVAGAPRRDPAGSPGHGLGLPSWPSVFHLAVTADDVEAAVARIVASGGRQVTPVLRAPRCTLCYCQDPFGTVIEVVDRAFAAAHEPTAASGTTGGAMA